MGINQPLPLPSLVFGSLIDRWNILAPLPLPAEVRAAADELLVNNFALRSVPARTKDGALQIGAVGHCTYSAAHPGSAWLAGIDLLARFAFYSGVGAGTARGFGQARLINVDSPRRAAHREAGAIAR
jgi:CRISPR-associated endoribonuclease Cas6